MVGLQSHYYGGSFPRFGIHMTGRWLKDFSSYGSYSYKPVLHRCLASMHWAVVILIVYTVAVAQQAVAQRV